MAVPCRRSASSGSTRMASCRVVRASRQPSPTSSRSGAGTRAEHSREALHPHMRIPGADVAAPTETARPRLHLDWARPPRAQSTCFRWTFVLCTHARTRSRPSRPCSDGRAPNSPSAGGWCVSAIRGTSNRNDARSPFHSGAHGEREIDRCRYLTPLDGALPPWHRSPPAHATCHAGTWACLRR